MAGMVRRAQLGTLGRTDFDYTKVAAAVDDRQFLVALLPAGPDTP
jgi:hypothetical protein